MFDRAGRRGRARKCWPKALPAERIEVRRVARSALPRARRVSDHRPSRHARRLRRRLRGRARAALRLRARTAAAGDRRRPGRSRSAARPIAPRSSRHVPPSEPPAAANRHGCTSTASRTRRAVFDRARLAPGDRIVGPAIVCEATVDHGHRSRLAGRGARRRRVVARRCTTTRTASPGKRGRSSQRQQAPIPIRMLEIFNNQFAGIAEQMGITLRNTASSVNVKERLDFSCAIFTPRAIWSSTRRTFPCIWGRWARRCARSSPTIRTCSRATSS